MSDIQVRVLGRCVVTVDGEPVHLAPITTAVLIRLLLSGGEPVRVGDLYHDVWARGHDPARFPAPEERALVHRRVLELRKLLEPGRPSETSGIVRTIRLRHTAYSLSLPRDRVDLYKFEDWVAAARAVTGDTATALLRAALALWDGRSALLDVAERGFAAGRVLELDRRRLEATVELARRCAATGAIAEALAAHGEAVRFWPDEPVVRDLGPTLAAARRGAVAPASAGEDVPSRGRTPQGVRVLIGDLFDQRDAHLAIGFCDTFDTATKDNVVINKLSQQGQLLDRVYRGDLRRLDNDLRVALRGVARAGVESRRDKRHGKLIRYPVSTTAVLPYGDLRIFAVAYSRMGNDLMAQSSEAALRASLDQLWEAVYRHGQLLPVAMPVFGTGLSRIPGADSERQIDFIIDSFTAAARLRPLTSDLRIVISPRRAAGSGQFIADAGMIEATGAGTR